MYALVEIFLHSEIYALVELCKQMVGLPITPAKNGTHKRKSMKKSISKEPSLKIRYFRNFPEFSASYTPKGGDTFSSWKNFMTAAALVSYNTREKSQVMRCDKSSYS